MTNYNHQLLNWLFCSMRYFASRPLVQVTLWIRTKKIWSNQNNYSLIFLEYSWNHFFIVDHWSLSMGFYYHHNYHHYSLVLFIVFSERHHLILSSSNSRLSSSFFFILYIYEKKTWKKKANSCRFVFEKEKERRKMDFFLLCFLTLFVLPFSLAWFRR